MQEFRSTSCAASSACSTHPRRIAVTSPGGEILPKPFRFGVACADHQCESSIPDHDDVWDVWERRRALTARGRATDFWNRYREDVALAQSLGCSAFRFSIAWARVEPEPGTFDDAAFDHYREVAEAIRAAGMETIVTLHHYTWPLHIEQRGGAIDDAFPERFTAYAREAARRLGDVVTYWITFNEPNQLVYGYVKPWWARAYFLPPGLHPGATTEEQMDSVRRLMRNLFLAHTKGRAAIAALSPHARVGTNPLLLGYPVWLQRIIDARATRVRSLQQLVRSGRRFTERMILEHGDVDVVIAQLAMTPQRDDAVSFSESYFIATLRLLVPADSAIQTLKQLSGKPVAVVRGTTGDFAAGDVVPEADAVAFEGFREAVEAVSNRTVSALLGDDVVLQGWAASEPGRFRLLPDALGNEAYAAAVTRGNRELLDVVDAAVRAFKESGGWATSHEQHLGRPSAEPPKHGRRSTLADLREPVKSYDPKRSRQPSAAVLRRIMRRGYLIVGVRPEAPGLCMQATPPEGFVGLEIDLARRIAANLFGDETAVRFVPLSTGQRIDSLRSLVRVFEPLLRTYGILFTLLSSDWWYLGMQGRLAEFLCPRECVGALDFVGLDYYWGLGTRRLGSVGRLFDAATQRYSLAPVAPELLYGILVSHAKAFAGKEVIVVENGCVAEADGITRDRYLRLHVDQVRRAIAAGIPVSMYVCWSITSNREWGLPLGKDSDFGLFHIDLDGDAELRRIPTASSEAYRDIIAGPVPSGGAWAS
ncbi:MAG: family 1 glycosylhydrolase [Candidatus Eremiobacteraeota bacterium]|nr:family 1 glycosylhydrolase [Candidatus Eremiobacteraeota bacterium]